MFCTIRNTVGTNQFTKISHHDAIYTCTLLMNFLVDLSASLKKYEIYVADFKTSLSTIEL